MAKIGDEHAANGSRAPVWGPFAGAGRATNRRCPPTAIGDDAPQYCRGMVKWISAHVSRWFRRRGESSPNAPGPIDHVIELKQALDSLVAQARQAIESTEAPNPLLFEACDNFTSRGPELLDEATRYLWA